MRHIPGLYLGFSDRGRAMFSAESIPKGSIIECCPVIFIPQKDCTKIHNSHLHDYYFVWPDGRFVIALGYGSLYNHSRVPNAEVIFDLAEEEIVIKALKNIDSGDEILIDYTDGDEGKELWFEVK